MKTPDYKKPFKQSDFRGYCRWSNKLSSLLGGHLYHACHREELETILGDQELKLRSQWSLKLPKHGLWDAPGIWTGLNYFHRGNYYGPFLISLPLAVLNGRHFMVFRREGDDRNRYFFVQYEARIPIYSFEKTLWRSVKPTSYFQSVDDGYAMKPGAIYDIVLTEPMGIDDVKIEAVEHPYCISKQCSGLTRSDGQEILQEIAKEEFFNWLKGNRGYARLFNRFPDLDGIEVELFDPSES